MALTFAIGLAAACGGADPDSSENDVAAVRVTDANTAAGRFPDEELVVAQSEPEAETVSTESPASSAAPSDAFQATEEIPAPDALTGAEALDSKSDEGSDGELQAGDDGESASSLESQGTVGIPAGSLAAGRYTSAQFEPAFSIELRDGWLSLQSELPDFVAFSPADDLDLSISFLSPGLSVALIDEEGEYTDADPAGDQLLDPSAFDYFDWIFEHSRYEAGEMRTELLAGRAVPSFEATLVSGYAWQWCLIDCALLIATSDGELLAQEVGYRERLLVADVGDLRFVVSIAAPVEKFDAFVGRAVEFLGSLELAADAEADASQLQESEGVSTEPMESPPILPSSEDSGEPAPQEAPVETGTLEEPEQLPPAPLAS